MSFLDNLLDVGKNLFPLGSRIFGGDDTKELSQQQQDKYLQMQQDYLNQIEPNRAARMEALGKSLSLFQPSADALNQMYGTNYDFGSLLSNDPMTAAENKIARANRANGAGFNIDTGEFRDTTSALKDKFSSFQDRYNQSIKEGQQKAREDGVFHARKRQ